MSRSQFVSVWVDIDNFKKFTDGEMFFAFSDESTEEVINVFVEKDDILGYSPEDESMSFRIKCN